MGFEVLKLLQEFGTQKKLPPPGGEEGAEGEAELVTIVDYR